eukprot:scaffold1201_cov247-Pinguiococcus_pyrenoidosus.AAC.7
MASVSCSSPPTAPRASVASTKFRKTARFPGESATRRSRASFLLLRSKRQNLCRAAAAEAPSASMGPSPRGTKENRGLPEPSRWVRSTLPLDQNTWSCLTERNSGSASGPGLVIGVHCDSSAYRGSPGARSSLNAFAACCLPLLPYLIQAREKPLTKERT